MADKKKGKQRKNEEEKPTKEHYAVAKYLRFNLPAREGKLHGMEVKCFFGNTAVDKLLESKWSATKNKKDPLFTNRGTCVSFMLRLLEMGLFHRAEREHRKRDKEKDRSKRKKKDKDGEKEESAPAEEELRERKVKKDRKGKRDKDGEVPPDDETEKKGEKKDDKKKKEKRLKLIMPEQQFFEDGEEIYVWIYDPVNAKTFLIGLLMVLGAIALCMFPLWPEEVRIGVYYLSIALAGFVGFILSLVVVRLILFCLIWTLTLGKHHFWLLPNLTEDVGFFDSFRPLYKHDVVSKSSEAKLTEGGKKKNKNDKEEDDKQALEAVEKKEKSSDKDDSDEFELIKKEDLDQNGVKEDNEFDKNEDDDEADVDNDGDDDIENDYDEDGAEDEEDNDDELGDDDEKEDDEEDSSELNMSKGDKKKKTK